MKKSTVKNLIIGTVTILGASYIIESCIKNKKRNLEIKNSKLNEEPEDNSEKVYHTIGNVVMEDGKPTVKKIKKVI